MLFFVLSLLSFLSLSGEQGDDRDWFSLGPFGTLSAIYVPPEMKYQSAYGWIEQWIKRQLTFHYTSSRIVPYFMALGIRNMYLIFLFISTFPPSCYPLW